MKSARLEAILERDDLEILRDMQAKVQVFLCDRVISNFLERRVMPRDIPGQIKTDLTSHKLKIAKGKISYDKFDRPYQQYLIKVGDFIYVTRLKAAGEEPGQPAELCIINLLARENCPKFKKSAYATFSFGYASVKNTERPYHMAAACATT